MKLTEIFSKESTRLDCINEVSCNSLCAEGSFENAWNDWGNYCNWNQWDNWSDCYS